MTFTPSNDYDSDDDGLIEIGSLAQLNAVRWDLDGNGTASGGNTTSYAAAFPHAKTNMGCNDDEATPSACSGYELSADLDFDTNGNGSADSGDTYWNSGAGWSPIGGWSGFFTGTFDGGGYVLSNLHINASGTTEDATPDHGGLFGRIGKGGEVKNLGLEDVDVTVSSTLEDEIFAGALAADNRGTITRVRSTGSVTGTTSRVATNSWVNAGGLVGRNDKGGSGSGAYEGVIRVGYSEASISGKGRSNANGAEARAGGLVGTNKGTIAASLATGRVEATRISAGNSPRTADAGGLVGDHRGTIIASYATGAVSSYGNWVNAGGLVGENNSGATITASYSTGAATGDSTSGNDKEEIGGLVGKSGGTVTNSYWDATTSGQSSSGGGTSKTTSELQTPTGYTGIYASWNVNVDGVTGNDDPWDFGTSSQYPILDTGYPPVLAVSAVTSTGATLTLSLSNGAWYYKANAAPHTACQSAVNTSGTNLTGLNPGTSYTYKAYSDSACTDANKLATASAFTTLVGLTASNIAATTATLTIAGHSNDWYYKANAAPDNTCKGPVTGSSTKDLTGLSANTTYTYEAYSDSACTTANKLATAAAFTTLVGLTASNVAATTATLTIAGHSNDWYYKANAAPDNTCQGPVSNSSTKDLTGLSANTSYTYEAFSDSACTTANKLATASAFTTLALSVSNVGATTATLTVTGHSLAWYYKANAAPDNTCQGPVTAGTKTKDLTGLSAGTTYTYTAYSDSACTTANLLATADAFTTGVSVSNLAEQDTGSGVTVTPGTFAQEFDTGSASGGWTLRSVTLDFFIIGSAPAITVSIRDKQSNGNPATTDRATFTGTLTGSGETTFTCATGCDLDGSTSYFVHVTSTSTGVTVAQTTPSVNQTLQPSTNGWSIGDDTHILTGGTWTENANAVQVGLEAAYAPSLAASAVTGTGATLTLSHYGGGNWYYDADTGPHTSCQGPVSTATETLTGLTAGTTYTYEAYSDSACTDANKIATAAAFAPATLAASNVTTMGATLTITWRSADWYYKADAAPDSTCKGPVAAGASTKALTGLTAGTTYTYEAYSDSTCTTANKLATAAAFTTLGLTVSNITSTTATLTISGHSNAWHYKANAAPDNTCKGPVTAGTSTKDLIGLSAGTTYTYTAYSDSACTTANELATASAFITSVTVGNLAEADYGSGNPIAATYAQEFTTGSSAGGYTLRSVTLDFTTGATPSVTVSIRTRQSNGNPGSTALATLTGTVANGETTFTCSTGCDLDASTSYFVHFTSTAAGISFIRTTQSMNETLQPSGNGWAIADEVRHYTSNAWTTYSTYVLQVGVEAVPDPALVASNVTATGATLTLDHYLGGDWYYEANVGPHATCQGPVSGSSVTLSGLTAGTAYIYTAYSNSACSVGRRDRGGGVQPRRPRRLQRRRDDRDTHHNRPLRRLVLPGGRRAGQHLPGPRPGEHQHEGPHQPQREYDVHLLRLQRERVRGHRQADDGVGVHHPRADRLQRRRDHGHADHRQPLRRLVLQGQRRAGQHMQGSGERGHEHEGSDRPLPALQLRLHGLQRERMRQRRSAGYRPAVHHAGHCEQPGQHQGKRGQGRRDLGEGQGDSVHNRPARRGL